MNRPRPPRGSEGLETVLDHAASRLQAERADASSRQSASRADRLIFSGNRHDAVPRALLLDRRLTPLERNAWQVFRLLLNDDGITAFPSYDELAPYLASLPGAGRASHETVARALTAMRLTRWISLARRRRDPATGRVVGNLYVLHDEPLTPYEGIQLDMDYLDLVGRSLTHASKSLQQIGALVLKEITEDACLHDQILPTRLQAMAQRMATQGSTLRQTYPQGGIILIPKTVIRTVFGIVPLCLRNPKSTGNARKTALFGFRRRPVLYKKKIIVKYILYGPRPAR